MTRQHRAAWLDALVALLRCPICAGQARFTNTLGLFRCPCGKAWRVAALEGE